MNLTNPEKLTLFLGAFRYYLGRCYYAVSCDPSESSPYSHGRLGHDIDRQSWQTLYNTINNQ